MANILTNPTHKARLGRNGFDMSKRTLFTSSVGQLLPVYFDELLPGDHVKFRSGILSRTETLNTAAYARITEHVEYFFVPFEQLYKPFGSWFYHVSDLGSSLLTNSEVSHYLPNFRIDEILDALTDVGGTGKIPSAYEYDEFGVLYKNNVARLLDLLGFPAKSLETDGVSAPTQSLSVLALAAYQKIFYDYYRLDNYDSQNYRSFNLDYYYNKETARVDAVTSLVDGLFKMRYRPWKKDYFTNILPSPLIGSSSTGMLGNSNDVTALLDYVVPNKFVTNKGSNLVDIYTAGGTHITDSRSSVEKRLPLDVSLGYSSDALNTTQSNTLDTVAQIRAAFALEKSLEITRRAKKTYAAQVAAHNGHDVPQGISHEVYFLGAESSQIQISDVVATSMGSAGDVANDFGQVTGKGYNYNVGQKQMDFTAPCHGIFMAIYSAVPDADYSQLGIDKLHTHITPESFYREEFDELGMQPQFGYESNVEDKSALNSIIGWQYRYSEYKLKKNSIHGDFKFSLRDWVTDRSLTSVPYGDSNPGGYARFLHVDPSYLNSIMLVDFLPASQDEQNNNPYSRDPLMHSIDFEVYKTSHMSTYGLPSL